MESLPDDAAMAMLLLAAFRGLVDEVHAALAEAGHPDVRATHGFAMQALADGCTSVELGRRLGVSKQAATKTAAALEAMGYVERRVGSDRREKLVVPTDRGRDMLQASGTQFRAAVARWRGRVGDDAVDSTLHTLATVDHGRRSDTDLSDWPGA